jgi:SAM-dependent methyltransferase
VDASTRWAEQLASWALPEEVLAQAPASPWGFAPERFADRTRTALQGPLSPTHIRCLQVLPEGGSVLDVGAGAGAAGLPLVPPASRLVAVDESPAMHEQLRALAGPAAVEHVVGRWPDVASEVGQVDVAVCAHVLYNVGALDRFVTALSAAATRRVVVELTAVHPQAWLSPLWRQFWGLDRPTGPVAADAAAVVREVLGVEVRSEAWQRPHPAHEGARVAEVRRRLCLPESADDEVAAALAELPAEPADLVTLWWTPPS